MATVGNFRTESLHVWSHVLIKFYSKSPKTMRQTCKNCEHRFEGSFCNPCGQSAITLEINFKNTILELQVSLIQLDKVFFYTTRELLLRPGLTI